MYNCSKCIFYNSVGYQDMGFTCPECKFKLVVEKRKKDNNQNYDLFKALINDESVAETCPYFTFICDVVDLIENRKK